MDLELEREEHQMTDKQKEAIEILKRIDIKFFLCGMNEQSNYIVDEADKTNNAIETALNLIQTQQEEIEHQKEKRENQKKELAILNEKQKEFNKLRNTINSYKGQFKRQQTEIEKKDKIIDEMAEYLASIDFDEHCVEVPYICMGCPKEDDLDGYMQCIKQYFERKVENGR